MHLKPLFAADFNNRRSLCSIVGNSWPLSSKTISILCRFALSCFVAIKKPGRAAS